MTAAAETLVIGASAAGLATAAELRRRGREFEVVEAADVVAASWRRHYDRLHLHTPKGFSALPGGLYFCGMYVSPAGMLREIGIEAARIATHINR